MQRYDPEYVHGLPIDAGIIGGFDFLLMYLNFLNVHYVKRDMGLFFPLKNDPNNVTFFRISL